MAKSKSKSKPKTKTKAKVKAKSKTKAKAKPLKAKAKAPAAKRATPGVPPGYYSLTPYLIVRDAGKAIEFYKSAFGATEIYSMPSPDGQRLMHAELQFGDSRLMMAEEAVEMGCRSPLTLGGTATSLHFYVPDVDAAFARALAAGAAVKMPPTDMFWGDRFSKLGDPFGHEWSLATKQSSPTPEEMAAGAAALFAKKPNP